MKEPLRPDAAAAALRVKDGVRDLARGALGAAGDLASEVADGYRKSTRFFKLRAGVVGAWVLLSALTFWAACPSSGPGNALGARVRLERVALMGLQVGVENDSNDLWKDVVLTLDGGWRYEKRTVRPHDKLVVAVTQFRRGDEGAPADLEPRTLTVECDRGRVTAPLGGR
jgi:hypothetical protein